MGLYLHTYSAYIKDKLVMEIDCDRAHTWCKLLLVVPDLGLWIEQAAQFLLNGLKFSNCSQKYRKSMTLGVGRAALLFSIYAINKINSLNHFCLNSKNKINSLNHYLKSQTCNFFLKEVQHEIQLQQASAGAWPVCPIRLDLSTSINKQHRRGDREAPPVPPQPLHPKTRSEGTRPQRKVLQHPSGNSLQHAKQAGEC